MVGVQVPDICDAIGGAGEEEVLFFADAEVEDAALVGFEQSYALIRVERVDDDLAALGTGEDCIIREGKSEDRGVMAESMRQSGKVVLLLSFLLIAGP